MSNKLTVAIALAAGLTGGLFTRYIAPPSVFAQAQAPNVVPSAPPPAAQTPAAQDIRARSFTLVDPFDNAAGTFSVDHQGPMRSGFNRIVLRDANGREIWSAGGTVIRPLVTRSN